MRRLGKKWMDIGRVTDKIRRTAFAEGYATGALAAWSGELSRADDLKAAAEGAAAESMATVPGVGELLS